MISFGLNELSVNVKMTSFCINNTENFLEILVVILGICFEKFFYVFLDLLLGLLILAIVLGQSYEMYQASANGGCGSWAVR